MIFSLNFGIHISFSYHHQHQSCQENYLHSNSRSNGANFIICALLWDKNAKYLYFQTLHNIKRKRQTLKRNKECKLHFFYI
jgi:hypothetical protein